MSLSLPHFLKRVFSAVSASDRSNLRQLQEEIDGVLSNERNVHDLPFRLYTAFLILKRLIFRCCRCMFGVLYGIHHVCVFCSIFCSANSVPRAGISTCNYYYNRPLWPRHHGDSARVGLCDDLIGYKILRSKETAGSFARDDVFYLIAAVDDIDTRQMVSSC